MVFNEPAAMEVVAVLLIVVDGKAVVFVVSF